jgi:hypothetical protein
MRIARHQCSEPRLNGCTAELTTMADHNLAYFGRSGERQTPQASDFFRPQGCVCKRGARLRPRPWHRTALGHSNVIDRERLREASMGCAARSISCYVTRRQQAPAVAARQVGDGIWVVLLVPVPSVVGVAEIGEGMRMGAG